MDFFIGSISFYNESLFNKIINLYLFHPGLSVPGCFYRIIGDYTYTLDIYLLVESLRSAPYPSLNLTVSPTL